MDRSARVRRLKRIIVGTVIAMILLPTVLCIFLFFQLSEVRQDLRIALNANSKMENRMIALSTELTKVRIRLDEMPEVLPEQEESFAEEVAVETLWPQKVYLTFDDGPSGHTGDILNILDRYGVKGNFFVCATKNEDYLKYYSEILNRGHVLGIHSYSHLYRKIYRSNDSLQNDVIAIRDFVKEQTDGFEAKYYRFPGGSTSISTQIDFEAYLEWLDEQGLTYYDWNVSSHDATNPMQPTEVIYENCTHGCEKYQEVMILMHDLGNKDSTVEALPQVIEYYLERGAEIAAIDENSMLIQHDNK